MKRKAVILAAIGLMVGLSAAVVGHNGSGDGDMSITSGSSASATSSVTSNGTTYTGKVEMTGRSQNQTANQISDANYESHETVRFSGTISAGTPCHTIDQEINETNEGTYVMNVKTVKEDLDEQACAEVITGINYDAEFSAESGFQLEVQHNGETIETFEDRVVEDKPEPSLFQRILTFFGL